MESGFSSYLLGVTLLHKCNFNCPHCGYLYAGDSDDHEIKPGYRLTWEQLMILLDDCKSVKGADWGFVINGGEPTLWEEGEKKFIDFLLEASKAGIHPSYNTNGSYFSDYKQTYDFFHKYADNAANPLMTAVSMDKFHNNYDRAKGRADSLDNVTKVLGEMSAAKRAMHRVHVITIISKDPNSYLPKEMKEYYGAMGITFGEFPLQPIGKAKNLMDEMPDPVAPPPPKDEKGGFPVGTLIGEWYTKGPEKVVKLGHLKDAFKEKN
jgi:organic radical activating enzyme